MTTISKTHTHRINMGPYESLEVSATVTMPDVDDTDEALDAIDAMLYEALEREIAQAKSLAIDDSYIHDWKGK